MKEFDWNEFKKCRTAVNCRTKEENEDFLNQCEKNNIDITWLKNKINLWEDYKERTVYEVNFKRVYEKLRYAQDSYYKEKGYKILDWSDYMNNENNQNKYDIEKTFKEINNDIQEGETWENGIFKISRINNGIRIWRKDNIKCNGFGILDDMKFKLERKEYGFNEAFNEYENNNLEIESIVTGRKFKKMIIGDMLNDCIIYKEIKEFNNRNDGFTLEEIRGKWYINK